MNLGFSNGLAQQWAVITCTIAGALLCTALFMEHVMGLAPCPLCMMQRLWVAMVGIIAYVGLLHNPRWGIYPLFGCVAAVIGGGFSSGNCGCKAYRLTKYRHAAQTCSICWRCSP